MPNCAVATCRNCNRNTKGTDIKYFTLPKNSDLAKQWVIACHRQNKLNLKNACICSIHFEKTCFEIPLKFRLMNYVPSRYRCLKADAIPTLNLPGGSKKHRKSIEEKTAALVKMNNKLLVESLLKNSSDSGVNCTKPESEINNKLLVQSLQLKPEGNSATLETQINNKLLVESLLMNSAEPESNPTTSETQISNKLLVESLMNATVHRGPSRTSDIPINSYTINQQNIKKEIIEEPIIIENENETIKALENKIEYFKKENAMLLTKLQEKELIIERYKCGLENVFTPGQIRKFMNTKNGETKIRWSSKDMMSAFALRSLSSKAYSYLHMIGYPLPAMSTLRRWASTYKLDQDKIL